MLRKRLWKVTEANFDQIIGSITIRVVVWANRPKYRGGLAQYHFFRGCFITTTRQKTQHISTSLGIDPKNRKTTFRKNDFFILIRCLFGVSNTIETYCTKIMTTFEKINNLTKELKQNQRGYRLGTMAYEKCDWGLFEATLGVCQVICSNLYFLDNRWSSPSITIASHAKLIVMTLNKCDKQLNNVSKNH